MGKGTWDDAANAKLLLAILQEVKLSSAQYDKIATYMGNGMTGNAIHCHIHRLKKKIGSTGSSPKAALSTPKKSIKGDSTSAGNTPATPTPKRSLPARKRSKPIMESESDTEDNDFELQVTPPPKKAKCESSVKEEKGVVDENIHIDDTA